MKNRAKQYYLLTKPGIIRGNLFTASAGYFLGVNSGFLLAEFIGLLVGTGLIIASGCVANNYIDRYIDAKMHRTKQRATVTGAISTKHILLFAISLGLLGFATLTLLTNWLAVLVGAIGLFFYVGPYSLAKRRGPVGTLVGSVSGATPPVAGYVVATGSIDMVAGLLFLILVFWQMAHFYAIGIFRGEEYRRAGLPLLPIVRGTRLTRSRIIGYITAFMLACMSLLFVTDLGYSYAIIVILMGIYWLWYGMKPINKRLEIKWARGVFGSSLVVLLVFSFSIALGTHLP